MSAILKVKQNGQWTDIPAIIGPQGERGLTGATGPAGADGVGVPSGGTTGQVLVKKTNTDYDTEWSDGLGDLENKITQLNEEAFGLQVEYEQGYWAVADGTAGAGAAWIRTVDYLPPTTSSLTIDTDTNIVAFVLAYESGVYIGCWNGTVWTKTYDASDGQKYYDIASLKTANPTYEFKLSIHRTNSGAISPSDATAITVTFYYPEVATKQDVDSLKTEMGELPTDVQVNGVSVLDAQGVANVPVASGTAFGVMKVSDNGEFGATVSNGLYYLARATNNRIKTGIYNYQPIVPSNQHQSTFFGLAKAAGADMASINSTTVGVYPEAQKSAISQMLNGSVTVTGSTPSITALPGIRYVCGEVATLDITLPASGIVDVVFESGATATVLTITPPTGVTLKWANGFDPTALEADTVYEINIADGLGVAGTWT